MTRIALALVGALVLPASAQFSNKSFGDGGGYKHPDKEAGQFLEEAPRQGPAELKPEPGPIPAAKPVGGISPAPAIPSRPRPIPFSTPLPAKAEAPALKLASAPPATAPEKAPSLNSAPAAAATEEDGEAARRDYDSKILGAPSDAARPKLGLDQEYGGNPQTASGVPSEEGMLFVSLELDAKEAGSLRDAVAGLGAAAAFRPDARFEPVSMEGGVRLSGWVPASRLGDAIARPGVRRVSVERGSRPAPDQALRGSFLLTVRLPESPKPEEAAAEAVRAIAAKTGFRLDRVFGVDSAPGKAPTALVSGTLPLSSLSKVMGLPDVVKITAAETPAAPAAPAPAREGFLKFVMGRALWLVLLTLLLILPAVGGAVRRSLSVFVPYR